MKLNLKPLSKFIPSKKIIYGCDSRGDGDSPYLTRYTLSDNRFGKINLHVFHRSDHPDHLHNHPWSFITVILWRGYIEETGVVPGVVSPPMRVKRRIWPGMILYRHATHTHRVELVGGKKAVTLVFTGKPFREWGFFTEHGFEKWREYFINRGC